MPYNAEVPSQLWRQMWLPVLFQHTHIYEKNIFTYFQAAKGHSQSIWMLSTGALVTGVLTISLVVVVVAVMMMIIYD